MQGHLAEVHGHLIDQVLLTFRGVAAGWNRVFLLLLERGVADMIDFKNLLKVNFEEVKDCRRWDLVVDLLQYVKFEGLDALNREFFVSDFFVDHLHFQRVDVLVLTGDEHSGHSHNVEVGDFLALTLVFEVAVQQTDGEEEGLVFTLEVGEHFNHPVYHAGSQVGSDLVVG